mmetsp:Transcript_43144/g.63268  ORF Transcript_43144/g.63268 Transcript_43144/m.63268 type:complete len:231 (-) Transcript_43144:981-1673(-)
MTSRPASLASRASICVFWAFALASRSPAPLSPLERAFSASAWYAECISFARARRCSNFFTLLALLFITLAACAAMALETAVSAPATALCCFFCSAEKAARCPFNSLNNSCRRFALVSTMIFSWRSSIAASSRRIQFAKPVAELSSASNRPFRFLFSVAAAASASARLAFNCCRCAASFALTSLTFASSPPACAIASSFNNFSPSTSFSCNNASVSNASAAASSSSNAVFC